MSTGWIYTPSPLSPVLFVWYWITLVYAMGILFSLVYNKGLFWYNRSAWQVRDRWFVGKWSLKGLLPIMKQVVLQEVPSLCMFTFFKKTTPKCSYKVFSYVQVLLSLNRVFARFFEAGFFVLPFSKVQWPVWRANE